MLSCRSHKLHRMDRHSNPRFQAWGGATYGQLTYLSYEVDRMQLYAVSGDTLPVLKAGSFSRLLMNSVPRVEYGGGGESCQCRRQQHRYRFQPPHPQRSNLDPLIPHLEAQLADGKDNGTQLWRELQEQHGYHGS